MKLGILAVAALVVAPVWAGSRPNTAATPAPAVQISPERLAGKWSALQEASLPDKRIGVEDVLETLSFGPGNWFEYRAVTRTSEQFYCEGRYTIRNGAALLVGRSQRGNVGPACTGRATLSRDGETVRIQFRETIVYRVPMYRGKKKTWRTVTRFVPHAASVLRRGDAPIAAWAA